MLDAKRSGGPNLDVLSEWLEKTPEELEPILRARKNADKGSKMGAWDYTVKHILTWLLASKILHIHPSERRLDDLHHDIQEACARWSGGDYDLEVAYLHRVEELWPRIRRQARGWSHYNFLRKYGLDSELIFSYIEDLSPDARAMEFALGRSFGLLGQYVKVPRSDTMAYYMVMQESTARSFPWRDYYLQSDIVSYLQRVDYKPAVLSLAAGMATEWRDFGWRPEMLKELYGRVVAYDLDEKLPKYLPKVFGKPIEEYGVEYHTDDVKAILEDENSAGRFDIVYAKGFMSYHFSDNETIYYLSRCKRLLKPGGIFIFDVQTFELQMMRCATTLGWSGTSLKPDSNVRTAIERIFRLSEQVGLRISNYHIDPANKKPTFVQFCLKNGI